jgi:hypothetical protein
MGMWIGGHRARAPISLKLVPVVPDGPLDPLEIENHPKIEGGDVTYGRVAPHSVENGIRVATHVVGEKIHHGSGKIYLTIASCPDSS